MDKAIYGLAMPFNHFCIADIKNGIHVLELTNYEVTFLWEVVKLTLEHDHSRVIGDTNSNLTVKLNPSGLYFRMVPKTTEQLEAYEKVKTGSLRQCSLTFLRKTKRNYEEEDKARSLVSLINPDYRIHVNQHVETMVHEICLTNEPGLKGTFCTTNKDHPLLEGVIWDGA